MRNRCGSGALLPPLVVAIALAGAAHAQEPIPPAYQAVLDTHGKRGDWKDGVLRVGVPRTDLRVTVAGRPVPVPFGFGGWVAMTRGDGDSTVVMGDLVLLEDEVNPVASALLDQGLDVTALHNHFFWEQPRVFFIHIHGHGQASDLARRLRPALSLIDRAVLAAPALPLPAAPGERIDGARLAAIVGHPGEQTGDVYKITIGRPDIDLREHGARIGSRMGLNTWAAFAGSPGEALVAGDVAMKEGEVTPVLRALRGAGIDIVALHHHMVGPEPVVLFVHYLGRGDAAQLARGVRAALDCLGRPAR